MMRSKATILRTLVHKKRFHLPSLPETLNSYLNSTSSYSNALLPSIPFYSSAATPTSAQFQLPQYFTLRRYLSSSSSGPSNVVVIDSVDKFNSSLRKVEDEALPAIFYFTAVWCGPCRQLSPILAQLSEKYPQVTTYKIDIDQEGLGSVLMKFNIYSVPTLHFFKDGKKTSEVIGADVERLRDTMETLYK